MTTKTILAAIAGAIVAMVLGYLVFDLLLGNFYRSHTIYYAGLIKDPPAIWSLIVFNLSWSFLLSIVFSTWANITSFGRGVMAGLWMGFLVVLTIDCMSHSFMHLMDHSLLIVDVLLSTAGWGLIGGVIGMVLGMGKKTGETA